ncbi:serine hydrolase domain-containing protein [Natronospora cellulosivora (SeqCode)]
MDKNKLKDFIKEQEFSGVVRIEEDGRVIFNEAYGYADRNNLIVNRTDTKFGIASGCKLFTAIAILQLVEKGALYLETYLDDCLDFSFPNFDSEIKVCHLLNHSSGIPDYFDEELMDDFSVLWESTPMYKIRNLEDFLPMFREGQMDFKPGERFKYNNAGFIVLGLIVEAVSGMNFRDFVQKNIFEACDMSNSGYYALDKSPGNTAYGYEKDESGEWKTNIYSIPVIGGSDGGAFTTTEDLAKLWKALLSYELLSEELTVEMLKDQIQVEDDCYYGLGIWLIKKDNKTIQYYICGEDPGVTMISSVFPEKNVTFSILANSEYGTWDISGKIEELMELK